MSFHSEELIYDLVVRHKYPKIHDDIFNMSSCICDMNVMDLGCCFGLLSNRLATRNKLVVGIEANKSYFDKCVANPKVKYVNLKVNMDTMPQIRQIVKENNIKALYARRVMPELYETGGLELCEAFAKAMYDTDVTFVVLEGRVKTKNATNFLSSIDREVTLYKDMYQVMLSYKNCRLLRINKK